MSRTPHRIGVAAVGLGALAVLAWVVLAPDPAATPTAPPSNMSEPMAKAIATGNQPAIVTIPRPPATARSMEPGDTALQITVRPQAVEKDESYLVNVYVVPPPDGAAASPAKEEKLLGSFSFFPPPRIGEERTFTLPAPAPSAGPGGDIALKVEMVPVAPDTKLEKSALAVVNASIHELK